MCIRDRPNVQAAMDKLTEELEELQTAVADHSNVEEELGDLLFAAVKIARFFQIDAEDALAGTCEKLDVYKRQVYTSVPGTTMGLPPSSELGYTSVISAPVR